MGFSFEDIKKIQEEFINKYFINPPVNAVGISRLRLQFSPQKIILRSEETLDDLCISVGFETQPPENMMFPSEYNGVRVFYQVNGPITLV